ncbi:hypothetical protein IGI04_014306 [Brassica rapa subsp. trilocularis]|uniref:Uncharacterized protein n=1 Tax=Brassica rapa subsp. trilocularis TaxID=1813537 RepID=A0ABQ7MLV5_BRACM|nr:hypothetical protein IGI04_014306 [Brassica rapa subsp. trilocularis]
MFWLLFLLKMVKPTIVILNLTQRVAESAWKREAREARKKSPQDEVARKAASEVVAGATEAHGSSAGVIASGVPEVRKSLSDVRVATEAVALHRSHNRSTRVIWTYCGAVVDASMAPPSSSVLPFHPTRGSLLESIPKEAALEAFRCSSDNQDRRRMKGLNLRAGTSYSSGKDAYAMSFEFPSYTSLYDDGKAYVCCCREVRLDRDLSFLEDTFTKNDSYKRLFCSYELHLGWVNRNWEHYECNIQDARSGC